MIVTFRIRRDTAANWTSTNPVLALGEPGLETDTRRVKYGDGSAAWTALAYSSAGPVAWADITGKPAFGSLALQNAESIAVTGGSAVGLTYVGVNTATPRAPIHLSHPDEFAAEMKISSASQASGCVIFGDGGSAIKNVGIWRGAQNSYTAGGNWLNIGGYDGVLVSSGNQKLGSQTAIAIFDNTALRPAADNSRTLGLAASRWSDIYSNQFRPGSGAPIWTSGPGAPSIAAPVGSLYTRTDGGSNSTLYVKESGTGTSGWVAK